MSKRRVPPKTATTNVPAALAPDELEQLLVTVEDRCNHAAGIVSATARVVAGDELRLHDAGVPGVFGAALERIAEELESLGDRALKARTAGGRTAYVRAAEEDTR